jgi:hypothetical protein
MTYRASYSALCKNTVRSKPRAVCSVEDIEWQTIEGNPTYSSWSAKLLQLSFSSSKIDRSPGAENPCFAPVRPPHNDFDASKSRLRIPGHAHALADRFPAIWAADHAVLVRLLNQHFTILTEISKVPCLDQTCLLHFSRTGVVLFPVSTFARSEIHFRAVAYRKKAFFLTLFLPKVASRLAIRGIF